MNPFLSSSKGINVNLGISVNLADYPVYALMRQMVNEDALFVLI
jgi:hypothetical protein